MKKLAPWLLLFLLAAPELMLAADNNAPTDQALEAAAYQQGDAADTSPPVTTAQPMRPEPKLDETSNKNVSPEAAAATTADADALSKNTLVFSEQIVNLQNDIRQLENRQETFSEQLGQLKYGVAVLSGVILILAFLLLRGKKKPKSAAAKVGATRLAKAVKAEDDTRTEYDFMGSNEGISAKLDLARAYIAMEDYTSARETLSEILGEGNEAQRQEARALLSKIKE